MRTLNDYFLTAEIEDVSTASSTFVAVPDGGKIIKIITALQGAISGGNAAISFEIVFDSKRISSRFCWRFGTW